MQLRCLKYDQTVFCMKRPDTQRCLAKAANPCLYKSTNEYTYTGLSTLDTSDLIVSIQDRMACPLCTGKKDVDNTTGRAYYNYSYVLEASPCTLNICIQCIIMYHNNGSDFVQWNILQLHEHDDIRGRRTLFEKIQTCFEKQNLAETMPEN